MNTLEQLREGKLAGTRRLKLACGLKEFPREIFVLADTLEILDLSGNALSSLPADLPRLSKLRILFCSDNQFTELPEVLGQCSQLSMLGFKANVIESVPATALPEALRWLILTDNQIKVLPAEIGNCRHLQKLMLAGNLLQTLPAELARCERLELIRIAANQLTELPAFIFVLPRLSWLAYAGNPFCEALEELAVANTPIPLVQWSDLQIQHTLGEGASGVIHQAEYQVGEAIHSVAVKMFKGAITSDGLPNSEMAACIRAGEHPNLIRVLGRINGHPKDARGLVLRLIGAEFNNLAGPPSLESCTRDSYPKSIAFDLEMILGIVCGIASAARHLHLRGILHGDLYAHNMLHCGQGRALLGDFGAASFFTPENRRVAERLQRIEVRAFGYLLEELIERRDVSENAVNIVAGLTELKAACLSLDVQKRPLFEKIERTLLALKALHQKQESLMLQPVS